MDILINFESYLLGRGLSLGKAAIYLGHRRRFNNRISQSEECIYETE